MLLPTKGPKGLIVASEDLATLLYNLPKLLLVDQKFFVPSFLFTGIPQPC
jgi:hypothetical protein